MYCSTKTSQNFQLYTYVLLLTGTHNRHKHSIRALLCIHESEISYNCMCAKKKNNSKINHDSPIVLQTLQCGSTTNAPVEISRYSLFVSSFLQPFNHRVEIGFCCRLIHTYHTYLSTSQNRFAWCLQTLR